MTTRIPEITRYQDWLQEKRNLSFENYDALWRWSTSDLDGFWDSIWSYMGIESASPPRGVLAKNVMPGAEWFPGATLNYATHVLRHVGRADAAG
ncbi:MAG: acetyl-coenzyme A synthetase N-terminal domain-containing protein, partial [Burkholderiaceae bacterium]